MTPIIRRTASVTIANGGTTSTVTDLGEAALLGFIAPAAWTAATLQIEVSLDNIAWSTAVFDSTGTAAGLYASITANAAYAVDITSLLPYRYVRLTAGGAQGAERIFKLIIRPLA